MLFALALFALAGSGPVVDWSSGQDVVHVGPFKRDIDGRINAGEITVVNDSALYLPSGRVQANGSDGQTFAVTNASGETIAWLDPQGNWHSRSETNTRDHELKQSDVSPRGWAAGHIEPQVTAPTLPWQAGAVAGLVLALCLVWPLFRGSRKLAARLLFVPLQLLRRWMERGSRASAQRDEHVKDFERELRRTMEALEAHRMEPIAPIMSPAEEVAEMVEGERRRVRA